MLIAKEVDVDVDVKFKLFFISLSLYFNITVYYFTYFIVYTQIIQNYKDPTACPWEFPKPNFPPPLKNKDVLVNKY